MERDFKLVPLTDGMSVRYRGVAIEKINEPPYKYRIRLEARPVSDELLGKKIITQQFGSLALAVRFINFFCD